MNGSDSSFCSFLSSSSHSKPELLSMGSEKRHSNEQSCVSKTKDFSDIPRDCYAPEFPGYSSFIGPNDAARELCPSLADKQSHGNSLGVAKFTCETHFMTLEQRVL